jgi:hypothetical protein
MFVLRDLLAGVLLPAVLTAGTLVGAWRASRHRQGARDSRSWAGPLAIGVGFGGGCWALFGTPQFPPLDATEWLYLFTPILIVLGLFDSLARTPVPVQIIFTVTSVPASLFLLLWPLLKGNEYDSPHVIIFAVASILIVGWIAAMTPLAARVSAAQLSAILFCTAAATALTLLASGSQRLGQMGGVLAATQLAVWMVNYALGPAAVGRGVIPMFGILFGGLLLSGNSYAELVLPDVLTLLAAPLLSWAGLLLVRLFRRLPLAPIQLLLVASAAGAVAVRAIMRFSSD